MTAISALLSVYHQTTPDELSNCLESIKNQSLQPVETVVVLDGPVNPDIYEILDRFESDLKIRKVPVSRQRGLGPALRDGLEHCKGPLIARADTDDISVPERFWWQHQFLESNPEVRVLGGWLQEHDSSAPQRVSFIRRLPQTHEELVVFARKRNPLNHPTVMFFKDTISDVGSYLDYRWFEDYHLWSRVLLAGHQIANLPQVLVEAKADSSYFARRGGWQYALAESRFLGSLYKIGFLGPFECLIALLGRLPVRLLPVFVRRHFYRVLLRL
jgi:glycosyltransferase involved in cell wall biosynthesis